MLEDQPQFADIVGDLTELLRGRTLVPTMSRSTTRFGR
ncbi:DNA polymerase III (Epsilon subunit) DnaQ domain protein [Mycobacterium ulcerans str. Harvey]|uniref:DNA polymerase III (Epsilon subunit) DnaQ domain protein n=1 Tax=Mycobacterium ulcerans str. Harvey TaxID=1299332 RepID=A0ABN0RAG9_MYCUL|nr:DNA polymerase III (Epsilon subunit) DnaQ domain protein [Mycobacterium ulcerans str. Harvey]